MAELKFDITRIVDDVVEQLESKGFTPMKRGKWVNGKCTICGKSLEDLFEGEFYYDDNEINFCPKCGADMRDVPDTDVGEIANVVEFKKRLTDRQTAEALKSNAEGLLSKGMHVDIADLRYIKLAEYENKEENNVETTGS